MELDWKQKNVLVIGAGVSGFAAAKLARRFGAALYVFKNRAATLC